MNPRRDKRLPVLLLTLALITGLGLVIQQLNTTNTATPSTGQAFDSAQHASQQRQSEIVTRFEQAVLMLHAEQYDYAVAALHRVMELAPTMPEAHVNMGFALLGQSNPRAAHDFFQSALALRPDQANAYWGLAVSLEALCDIKGAIGAMRTYLHLENPDAKFVSRARAALWEWETGIEGSSSTTCQTR